MDAKQVVEKILADAKIEAENISKQANDKEAFEKANFDAKLSDYKKQTDFLANKAGDEKRSHILAAVRMEVGKEFLAEKRAILDEVFVNAKEQIKKLSDDDYTKIFSKLMKEAVETGDEEVIVDAEDKHIDMEFIKQVNSDLGPDFKGNLRLADEKQNIGAGFILRRGKIKNNVSVGVLLDQARKDLEITLSKELFAE